MTAIWSTVGEVWALRFLDEVSLHAFKSRVLSNTPQKMQSVEEWKDLRHSLVKPYLQRLNALTMLLCHFQTVGPYAVAGNFP